MAKAPIAAAAEPAPLSAQEDTILSEMLGEDLKAAILGARGATGDATVMCQIGSSPDPGKFWPGLVSIHRDGHETVYGLSHEDAIAQLGALA